MRMLKMNTMEIITHACAEFIMENISTLNCLRRDFGDSILNSLLLYCRLS